MYCDLQLIRASLGWYLNCLGEDRFLPNRTICHLPVIVKFDAVWIEVHRRGRSHR